MIKNIFVNNYRNLQNVKLEDIGRINLIFGENNSGKTSLLECIQLIRDEAVLSNLISAINKRELSIFPLARNVSTYQTIINTFDLKQGNSKYINLQFDTIWGLWDIGIEGNEFEDDILLSDYSGIITKKMSDTITSQYIRVFKGIYWHNDNYNEFEINELRGNGFRRSLTHLKIPVEYISPIDSYLTNRQYLALNEAIKSGEKNIIIELLNIFDENIINFEVFYEKNRVTVLLEHRDLGMIPLSLYGDGIRKTVTVAAAMIRAKDGILLIDEVETGIHKIALTKFSNWLIKSSKIYNVQLFITTHSVEAIDALLSVAIDEDSNNDIVGYRLETYKNRIYTSRFSEKKLNQIRFSQGLDIR